MNERHLCPFPPVCKPRRVKFASPIVDERPHEHVHPCNELGVELLPQRRCVPVLPDIGLDVVDDGEIIPPSDERRLTNPRSESSECFLRGWRWREPLWHGPTIRGLLAEPQGAESLCLFSQLVGKLVESVHPEQVPVVHSFRVSVSSLAALNAMRYQPAQESTDRNADDGGEHGCPE